ncbi:MAG: ATP-dependent DNA ligase, partial [Planctomycetota bacterium]|nr:ATP-dependent DNA ligase [Planctomycetota bacterium]
GVVLLGRAAQPDRRFGGIARDAAAVAQQGAEHRLRANESLLRGAAQPLRARRLVGREPVAVEQHQAEIVLRLRVALLGGAAEPARRLLGIARAELTLEVQHAEIALAVALAALGGAAAAEWKLDGIRVQVHRKGDDVRVFTRSLRDVTEGTAGLVALARALPVESLVLDGEAVGHVDEGEPLAFQDLMSRFQTGDAESGLGVRFFDVLSLEGAPFVDRPDRERRAALEDLLPSGLVIPRRLVTDPAGVQAALDEALAHGHEGLVLKALDAPYAAGRRGANWRKLKLATTVDLVILGAEWGHGRRSGWLSNLHLGARDPDDPERFVMVGKTFKGLTDAMLRELTEALPPLATEQTGHVVLVRPERVVEVAFEGVQRSSRYPGGVALRFARVKRFRPDKRPADATTLDALRAGAS